MSRDDFNAGVNLLKPLGLEYDLLIYERQLPQAIEFVDRHPGQLFVVDHIAKPRIRENVISPWRENILALAHRPNVYCKISGMATEADYAAWTPEQLKPYFDTVLEAFGPHRLMFGTDWPVCLVACDYSRWYRLVRDWAAELSDHDQDRIFGETAMEAYKLK
jgi:L-fuconolactonase